MRELDLLATFLQVYRSGSITAAATQLGVSQPSVSERIARLEGQVGGKLFERSTRGVAPTSLGDTLAAQIGEPIDRLRATLTTPTSEAGGEVRIGGASDVVASRVIPSLASLSGRIRLTFTLGLADDLLDQLADGALDLVVSPIRPTGSGIHARGLVDEEFLLVGAPSLARTIDPSLLLTDPSTALVHLPIVAYDEQLSIVRRYWRSQFGRRPTNPVNLIVPDLRAILAAVIAGAGISALPRYLADAAVSTGSVEILHRPDESPINTLYLAVPANEPPSQATKDVIARLLDAARDWDTL